MQSVVPEPRRREPHGAVGAAAAHRAIAQGNSAEIAEVMFRYSAPEEVSDFANFGKEALWPYWQFCYCSR